MRAINRDSVFLRPAVDRVIVRVAEKEIASITNPDRPFGEKKATSELLDFGILGNNPVEGWIITNNLSLHLLNVSAIHGLVEIERG